MAVCPLTPAQLRVMRMVCDGFTYQEIALKLERSENTVRTHVHDALRKLGAVNGAQAAVVMMREGWHHHAIASDLGDDVALSHWTRVYLIEWERFIRGPVECRARARGRSSLALLGMGWRARWRETDRLPERLAHILGLGLGGVYYRLRRDHGAAWKPPTRRGPRGACA